MAFKGKTYAVRGWTGEVHSLTAHQLLERVLEDSKSDYNWITSATELVRVCDEWDFPKRYARKIKVTILNCFANLETQREHNSRELATDEEAVHSCYHSLTGKDEEVVKAKRNYLRAIISATIKYEGQECRLHAHTGLAYKRVCEEWVNAKLREYADRRKIDFRKMEQELSADFIKTIQTAEEQGAFIEDDARHQKEMQSFWASLI